MDERAIPTGRFGRLARLAVAGARAATGRASAASDVALALGAMRGLAAKLGQMAGYIDGLVPEGQRDAYEAAMKGLQSAAPASRWPEVRALLREELGDDPSQLFASFDEAPFASASLGQVHRARLRSGEAVAVKVQHPGVDRAVESDLANSAVIEGLAALGGAKRGQARAMAEAVKARFREELDYRLEAERQNAFASFFAGDPAVRVPRVVGELSSRRVLTSELVTGRSFDDARATGDALRRAYAETLWRFVFKGTLVFGHFNADPHPGNYVFHDEGVVTFLDFGSVQTVDADRRVLALAAHRAAQQGDEGVFREASLGLLGVPIGPYAEGACAYMRRCFEPIFASPYRVTRDYVSSLVSDVKALASLARRTLPPGAAPFPPELIFLNRLQFGFYSVLARLDVEVDYRAVEAAFVFDP